MNMFAQEIIDFVLAEMPMGVIVYNEKMGITYLNRTADKILERYELPVAITTICKRIFGSIKDGIVQELFPGDIVLYQKIIGTPSRWVIRMHIGKGPVPLVYVFMTEEKISNQLDINSSRRQFRLTRRETDIVRRVLDGLRNNEIAEDCGISEQTVKDHLSKIFIKCDVRNRFELIYTLMNNSHPEPPSLTITGHETPTPYDSSIDSFQNVH